MILKELTFGCLPASLSMRYCELSKHEKRKLPLCVDAAKARQKVEDQTRVRMARGVERFCYTPTLRVLAGIDGADPSETCRPNDLLAF
jgi:hypothetical protein